ncbi:MAG: DUF2304 domain-containing protein [Pseudolabrys sp.]|nr:DUF2304 domain-containing protein [Pseudolabrys sp.]MBV9954281.1 DUF2304 domain-containing protein [Pseudolabrys sp.]
MIAQILLSVLLLAAGLFGWQTFRRAPLIGASAMAAAAGGLYFVWIPEHATRLAAFAGIGRGVDLILYIWVAISLLLLLHLHLKLRVQMELITTLARAIALAEARQERRPG